MDICLESMSEQLYGFHFAVPEFASFNFDAAGLMTW